MLEVLEPATLLLWLGIRVSCVQREVTSAWWWDRAGEDHDLKKGWRPQGRVFQQDRVSLEMSSLYFWKSSPVGNFCSWWPNQGFSSPAGLLCLQMCLSEKIQKLHLGEGDGVSHILTRAWGPRGGASADVQGDAPSQGALLLATASSVRFRWRHLCFFSR